MKPCTKCNEIKPLEDFHRRSATKDGRTSRCKVCVLLAAKRPPRKAPVPRYELNRRYRAKNKEAINTRNREAYHEDIEKSRAKMRRDNHAYPERTKARQKVAREIRAGRLDRLPCEVCGTEPAEAHHDDYSRENWLTVRFLCRTHHGEHHRLHEKENAL